MTGLAATITVNIDPTIDLGPVTLAWHGMIIAVGTTVGAWLAARCARERRLSTEALVTAVLVCSEWRAPCIRDG